MSDRFAISSVIRKHASDDPHQTAIVYQDQFLLTYQQYIQITDSIAIQLRSFELDTSDRLLCMFNDRINYLLAVLPIVECAVFTSSEPINDRSVLKEKTDLYKITWIVTDTINTKLFDFVTEQGIGLILMEFNSETLVMTLKKVAECRISDKPASFVKDLALITQTSGTTSTPKLIPKSYALLIENCIQEKAVYDVDRQHIRLVTGPVHRTNPAFNTVKFLYNQSIILFADSSHPPLIRHLIENYPVTHFRGAPATILSFMDFLQTNRIELSVPYLKYVFVTGAAINEEFVSRVEKVFHVPLIHTYGSTETSNVTSNYKAKEGYRLGSVGISVYHDVKIIDNEICIKGKTVFEGYLNADNSEYFTEGYFRTGDAGFIDDDGYLYITGRIKEMINRGGEKVSPYEVEKEIDGLNIFKEHAIFPYPGENTMEEIGLAAVLADSTMKISLTEVRRRLMNRVPSFKLPTKLILVDEIPKSKNSKIQRKQLYSLLKSFEKEDGLIETPQNGPASKTEIFLLEAIKKIVKIPTADMEDNFIALGGDSLKAAELYSEIVAGYQLKLPMVELFECVNLREMAALIDRYERTDHSLIHVVPMVDNENDQPPLVFIHAVAGDAVTYQRLTSKITAQRSIFAVEFNISKSDWTIPVSVEQVLEDYIRELISLQPNGTFILCGLSMGGRIALEIAHRLRQRGYPSSKVILLDTVFVRGNKHGKKIDLVRSWKRMMLDIKSKRQGTVFQFAMFKLNRLIQNRLARGKVNRQLMSSIRNKAESNRRDFTPAEIEKLVSLTFKLPIREQYDADVIYLLAMKEENSDNATFIRPRVKQFRQIEVDCYHQDFVSLSAQQTAIIIDQIIRETQSTQTDNQTG